MNTCKSAQIILLENKDVSNRSGGKTLFPKMAPFWSYVVKHERKSEEAIAYLDRSLPAFM